MKTMNKKGQGAMEYLMTYGWAILVVLIVGIVLWQLGIFSGLGGGSATSTGFSSGKIGIIDAATKCTVAGGLNATFTNQAGSTLTLTNITPTGSCTGDATPTIDENSTILANGQHNWASTCTGVAVGDKLSTDITVTFTEKVAGSTISRTQSGRITCTVES